LGERIASLVTKLAEDKSATQSRIHDLEIKLAAANVISKSLVKDHSTIQEELAFVKTEADLQLKALTVRLLEMIDEALAKYSRAEALVKSTFGLRIKFHLAKEQLCKYKKKAWNFYRQLTIASWGRYAGFGVGYIKGFKTFQEWVKKPGNFSKVETITPEDILSSKEIALEAQAIGQEEMLDCRGIKYIGFKPHLIYYPKARAEAKLPPIAKCKEDSDIDSTKSVGSSIESWDRVSEEDFDNLYL
jgi:hypothetical protein